MERPKFVDFDEARRLWVLRVIVEAGNLKQAAATLKVTPSAVSQTLRSLEAGLKQPLLIKRAGRIEATAEALKILDRVGPALDALADAFGPKIDEIAIGSLSFGTYESLAIEVIPSLLARLRRRFPKIRLKMSTARSGKLITQLRSGELCMALVPEFDERDRFFSLEVAKDELGFFAAPVDAGENDWSLVEKRGLGVLSSGPGGLPAYYSRFVRGVGIPNPVLVSDSFEVLRQAAESGSVVSLLPKSVASRAKVKLVELRPPTRGNSFDRGKHSILLVSPENCDRAESEFLADELRAIFRRVRGIEERSLN